MRLTDFFVGVVVGIGAALLFARCPRSTQAGERPVSEDAGLRVVKGGAVA